MKPPPPTPDTLVDTKNPRHTANCWKYFAHPPLEDGQANVSIVVCKICNAKLNFKGNTTSSMNTHLKMKHLISPSLSAMTSDSDLKRKNPNARTLTSMFNTPELPALPAHQQEAITQAVCKHIYKDCRPFSTVEMEGFTNLLHVIIPAYKLPCRATITSRVQDMANTKQHELKSELSHQPPGSVASTTDTWTSSDNVTYACTTGHFVNDDWELQERCLEVKEVSGAKGKYHTFNFLNLSHFQYFPLSYSSSIHVYHFNTFYLF
jgi:hypothetical protein